ncbi:opioid growth factor receptor [Lepisosteus oculatus]|uniref:Opioid growth factor receptor n=1 Tax=Lepisosteus oculatus TaxID=7918 RepID=W5M8B0_LEPOC|nr:PREDICTED: opioid growth factor receptor [Lepisosteus oculatus]
MSSDDDLVCDYDSTWESESEEDDPGGNGARRSISSKSQKSWSFSFFQPSRNQRAAMDMQNYRHGYPEFQDNEEYSRGKMFNLKFYLNEIGTEPDGIMIKEFLQNWKQDYKKLERNHSYIQWLFPLREPGMNYMAYELTREEIEEFHKNEVAKQTLIQSYELMLGFYGIELVNKETGEVKRAWNFEDRFDNLDRNMHNNLRITRILKCLGELGFEHYKAPLVKFFLEETLVNKELSSVKRSVLDYFLFSIRDKRKRRELIEYAYQHFEPKDKFVWCPRRVQKRFARKRSADSSEVSASEGNRNKDVHPGKGRVVDKGKDSKEEEQGKPAEEGTKNRSEEKCPDYKVKGTVADDASQSNEQISLSDDAQSELLPTSAENGQKEVGTGDGKDEVKKNCELPKDCNSTNVEEAASPQDFAFKGKQENESRDEGRGETEKIGNVVDDDLHENNDEAEAGDGKNKKMTPCERSHSSLTIMPDSEQSAAENEQNHRSPEDQLEGPQDAALLGTQQNQEPDRTPSQPELIEPSLTDGTDAGETPDGTNRPADVSITKSAPITNENSNQKSGRGKRTSTLSKEEDMDVDSVNIDAHNNSESEMEQGD